MSLWVRESVLGITAKAVAFFGFVPPVIGILGELSFLFATSLLKNDKPDDYEGKFIVERDAVFLDKAVKMFASDE